MAIIIVMYRIEDYMTDNDNYYHLDIIRLQVAYPYGVYVAF